MYCYQALAGFYAEKARAALSVLRYKYSNDIKDLENALPSLESSVSHFEKLAELAGGVAMTGHSLTHEWAERLSTRTGQTHPLGGFTGSADYQGELRELLPVLRAAQFTGVGRQTVWGKGEMEVGCFVG